MKRQMKKLGLTKETIKPLHDTALTQVAGASGTMCQDCTYVSAIKKCYRVVE